MCEYEQQKSSRETITLVLNSSVNLVNILDGYPKQKAALNVCTLCDAWFLKISCVTSTRGYVIFIICFP